MTFKIGDVVRLNSGGPPMTVTYQNTDKNLLTCSWFDYGHAEVKVEAFPQDALRDAKPENAADPYVKAG
jgi:uncharacterized protein YodC (DUF2158 family)